MKVGEKIKTRREQLGWSQATLGKKLGVTRNAVYLWETDYTAKIALDNRIMLSEILNLPLSDLLPPRALRAGLPIKDPQELLLIERFRELHPGQREAYLRLLVAFRGVPPPED